MAFQILITARQLRFNPVTFNVPDEITVICQEYITLEATLLSGSFTGHTVEWEQVEGYPVDWVGGDAARFNPIAVFSHSVRTDKVFTFWVDRGNFHEQSATIYVNTTPTDIVSRDICSVSPRQGQYQPWLTSNEEVLDFLLVPGPITLTDPLFWGSAPQGLRWTIPSHPGKTLLYSVLEENATGQFLDHTIVYPPNDTSTVFSPLNNSYRVRTWYKTNNILTYSLSETKQFAEQIYLYASGTDYYPLRVSTPNHILEETRTVRTLLMYDTSGIGPGDVHSITASISNRVLEETRTVRTLKTIGDTAPEYYDDIELSAAANTHWGFTINIIDRNNSAIGGGQ